MKLTVRRCGCLPYKSARLQQEPLLRLFAWSAMARHGLEFIEEFG